jgi:SAM-dependent methyltransferase
VKGQLSPSETDLMRLQRLSGTLLQTVENDNRWGNVLIIANAAVAFPESANFCRDEHSFGLSLHVVQGVQQCTDGSDHLLQCDSSCLPFQDDIFQTIVLYCVTADGAEAEFSEACRVLAKDGELLILGVNQNSWAGWRSNRKTSLPRMRLAQLRSELQQHDLLITDSIGVGLMGRSRPKMDWHHLSALGLPFADLLLLMAKYNDRPVATPLRLKKHSARVIPT